MFRRMILPLATCLTLLYFLAGAYLTPQMATPVHNEPTPSAGVSLPPCTTEEGAGQALCWWDAQTQGNGEGTSVVSGDCVIGITGDDITQDLCIALHVQGASEDGYATGADRVQDCIDRNSGIDLRKCFKDSIE